METITSFWSRGRRSDGRLNDIPWRGLPTLAGISRRAGRAAVVLWAGGLAVWGAAPAVMDPPVGIAAPGPRIAFAEMEFDFGELKQGQVVKHDFVFTNTGTEKLEILDVRPSCGCTTAGTWDRVIEAGATGRIPVQFSSVGFSGAISKSVAVTSTDPARSTVSLKIKANIFIPIEVSPTMAYFQYDGGETNAETKTIRILSHLKEALTLAEPISSNRAFTARLEPVTPGKEYNLQITTVPPVGTGTITAPITIKTSAKDLPELRVQVYAVERQPITVSPSYLSLPAGPLVSALQPKVNVQAAGARALAISEARIDHPEVSVKVTELQPGRLFSVQATFPAGFALEPGKRLELSIKSDHPRQPIIRVPVVQSQRPVPTRATPAVVRPPANRPLPQMTTLPRTNGAAVRPTLAPPPSPPTLPVPPPPAPKS